MIRFITRFINILFFPFTLCGKLIKILFSHQRLNKGEIAIMSLSKDDLKELVEDIVRKAISVQARELEKHLNDIHIRLQELEKKSN